MEISTADIETMAREFMDVETQVVRGYAIDYAREIYANPDDLTAREIARRNMYLCVFGMLERAELDTGSERCEFLNRETTGIVTKAAVDTHNPLPGKMDDSYKSWHK